MQGAKAAAATATIVILAAAWSVTSSQPTVANVIIPTSKADCDAIKAQYRAESRTLADQADLLSARAKGVQGQEWHRLLNEAHSLRMEASSKMAEGGRAWSRCMSSLARAKQLNEGLENLAAGKAAKAAKQRYIKSSNAALGASAIWDSPEILGSLSGQGANQNTYGILSKYGTLLASKYIDFAANNRLAPGRDNWLGSAIFSAAMAEIRQRHLEALAELERTAKEIANYQGTPDTLSTTTPLVGSPDPATQGASDSEQRAQEARLAEQRRQEAAQQARLAEQQRQQASRQTSGESKKLKTCDFEGGAGGLPRMCLSGYLDCLKSGGQDIDEWGNPTGYTYQEALDYCRMRASDLGMRPSDF